MQKFEYLTVEGFYANAEGLFADWGNGKGVAHAHGYLNMLGDDGWELVSLVLYRVDSYTADFSHRGVAIFKRTLNEGG